MVMPSNPPETREIIDLKVVESQRRRSERLKNTLRKLRDLTFLGLVVATPFVLEGKTQSQDNKAEVFDKHDYALNQEPRRTSGLSIDYDSSRTRVAEFSAAGLSQAERDAIPELTRDGERTGSALDVIYRFSPFEETAENLGGTVRDEPASIVHVRSVDLSGAEVDETVCEEYEVVGSTDKNDRDSDVDRYHLAVDYAHPEDLALHITSYNSSLEFCWQPSEASRTDDSPRLLIQEGQRVQE